MRRRETNGEFQRYQGFVPTDAAQDLLLYIAEKELILVKPGMTITLLAAMKKDPAPKAPFKPTFVEPTGPQFEAVRQLREAAGRDLWRIQRADELRRLLLAGYMDFRHFTKRTSLGEGALLRADLVKPRTERPHERALHLEPTKEGARMLYVADPWELLLIKPGMELPLFAACDPDQAAYWCELP